VQPLPSLQALPSGKFGVEQLPLAGEHTPAAWHWSTAEHTTGFDPTQDPLWQLSLCVHASLSEQAEPFVLGGEEHVPVAGEHVPASWH